MGESVAINVLPSPPGKAVSALFRMLAALTCFVLDIDLASALVYLAASLS